MTRVLVCGGRTRDLCSACGGAGSLFNIHAGKPEWWPCPACGGGGARVQYGPEMFTRRAKAAGVEVIEIEEDAA